ncbi:MAG TPA: PTS sugar transporter subunit IIB [Longimicrobiales bacterium]|nr:PTS sugar transporter subunit IIB [Longimicrobiales bacterium]
MAIVLLRVDERLIHGQVVVGWGTSLHPDRIVVVDDELAASTWEQELYTLGLPTQLSAEFATVAEARRALPDWLDGPGRVIVLTRDVRTMRRLAEDALLRGREVNIGGIHYAPGRHAILPYVYLSDEERTEMRRLADEGAVVTARDLPGSRRVDIGQLLGRH